MPYFDLLMTAPDNDVAVLEAAAEKVAVRLRSHHSPNIIDIQAAVLKVARSGQPLRNGVMDSDILAADACHRLAENSAIV